MIDIEYHVKVAKLLSGEILVQTTCGCDNTESHVYVSDIGKVGCALQEMGVAMRRHFNKIEG